MVPPRERLFARGALLLSLGVAWLNFLFTGKWAALPGALHGSRGPFYLAALTIATLLALFARRGTGRVRLPGMGVAAVASAGLLVFVFFRVFPPDTWRLLPFMDDWVPRFQSTADGVALLRRGAVVGWQWAFLGGYQTSADLSQSLTIVGAIPMLLFGDRVGFHLLHLALLAGIPLMVWRDAASDGDGSSASLSAVLAFVCAMGMFGTIVPSGDTNSIAGVFAAMIALTGSRLAGEGRRIGAPVLVGGLTLALYSHVAFFGYAVLYLAIEAWFYRDWRRASRAAVATVCALIAALPQHLELIAYRPFFRTNNLVYGQPVYDAGRIAREIYYNVEILLFPQRWFNDYLSLVKVFLALFVFVAWRPGTSRARLYAWWVVATMALLRIDVPEAGYLFAREMHMLAAFAAPPLAWFAVNATGDRRLAWSLAAVFALYPHTQADPIPHLKDVRQFDASLVDRLGPLDGARVLLESSPHRDLDGAPDRRTQRTPFPAHFEAFLPGATGQLYYGQPWDCWHWTPFRGEAVAGGAFRGEAIWLTPPAEFEREMRRWGVAHLFVWSDATRRYLDGQPERFARTWAEEPWTEYELKAPDPRAVVVEPGSGVLSSHDALAGTIRLSGVRRGTRVVVRTNYYPAWTARIEDRAVPIYPSEGQLAFDAPADGDYDVVLEYPRRRWLIALAVLAFVAGSLVISRSCATASSRSAAA